MDRQLHPQRPTYPSLQTQSQTSSAFNSSSSLASVSSQPSMLSPRTPLGQRSSAPLPSPTAHQGCHYFGSLQSQQQHSQAQFSQQHQEFSQHWQRQQQQPPNTTASPFTHQYQPDRRGAGQTAHETVRHLGDYNLVAEAARRAQIAVLTRDMEGVELR